MKTLPAVGFLAALVALLVFPLSVEVTGSVLFAAGFAAIAFSDYARRAQRPPVACARTMALPPAERRERFGLAA
jgi:hypothetical protein